MFGKRIGSVVFAVLALLLTQTVHSGVYKWTDENGKVHFGDRPPVEQETDKVAVPTGATPTEVRSEDGETTSPAATNASRQETRQRLLDQYAAERDAKRKAASEKREEQALRKANCAQAKDNLRNFQEHARMYKLDENGERVYYSTEEREQGLARAKGYVKQWCD